MATYEEFANWLRGELEKRQWDQAELVRRSRLDSSQVSRFLSGERKAGAAASMKLARALHLPPEEVFRQAGLLPKTRMVSPEADELLFLFNELTPSDQARLLAIARTLLEMGNTE